MLEKVNLIKKLMIFFLTVSLLITSVFVPASAEGSFDYTENSLITSLSYTYKDYLNDIDSSLNADYCGSDICLDTESVMGNSSFKDINGINAICNDSVNKETTFKFSVNQGALYSLKLSFIFQEETGYEGSRKILIDGKSLYTESNSISLNRKFVDKGQSKKNQNGDEVKPSSKEINEWNEIYLHDGLGRYTKPLMFALSAGEHTITVVYDKENIYISKLTLCAPVKYEKYADYISKNNADISDFYKRFQAEEAMLCRNDSSIGLASDGDVSVTPNNPGFLVMNTVGGYSFRDGGQSVTFNIDVDKSGYYQINLRAKQNWNVNMDVFRKIEINGEVPFEEMECYSFHYNTKWSDYLLSNNDNPYLFYLNKGNNQITLTAQLGMNNDIIRILENCSEDLSVLTREILMIIGQNPDVNYDYKLENTIPNLKRRLKSISENIQNARKMCDSQNGGSRTETGNSLESNSKQLIEMMQNTDEIPKRFNDLTTVSTNLGSIITGLQEQPLQIDYIDVLSSDMTVRDVKVGFFKKFISVIKSFLVSFTKNYIDVSVDGADAYNDSIEVWVGLGKEWAQVLSELTDSLFTPTYNIRVKYNVVPSGRLSSSGSANLLLLSVASGTEPDAALGISIDMPVEYAIRNASAELSQMDGYDKFIKNFPDNIMVPFEYSGGVYGIPQTASFTGMYYRTDIFSALDIKVPQTWDEVFNKLIPKLTENGMQFYMAPNPQLFVLSNGGSIYKTDKDGNIKSALDSEEAYEAFRLATDMYSVYGVPTAANFFNRFRTGEMPVGIGENSLYLQLVSAAPELAGKWSIVPVPYISHEDGTLTRGYTGAAATAQIILASSKKKEQTWDYIKWWMSDEVQKEYAHEVESRMGISARWISANKTAYMSLPWEDFVIDTTNAMWDDLVGIPTVPGSYTSVHIMNAWNRVVLNGMPLRESLELSVKTINKELDRKRKLIDRKARLK